MYLSLDECFSKGARHRFRIRQRARGCNRAEFAVLAECKAAERKDAVQLSSFGFKVISVAHVPDRIHDMSDKSQDVVGTTVRVQYLMLCAGGIGVCRQRSKRSDRIIPLKSLNSFETYTVTYTLSQYVKLTICISHNLRANE